jgi:DNA polymerase I-like protein with 3'-5' exonuclease and polymerase domains
MSFVTLDFETYYAKDFSLSRMTTEEYIRDPRFEVIGVSVKIDDGEPEWFSGTKAEVKAYLDKIDWANSALLCHNMLFDGAILAFTFGIVPAKYFDTLCMARAIHGVDAGGSLKALAERYQLGEKGTEVINALGKYRKDFTPEDLARYGAYCINDVDLTFKLFNVLMSDYFPSSELDLIDMTLRMYTEPVLRVNKDLLAERLQEIQQEKVSLLSSLMNIMDAKDTDEVRAKLASNPQFAEVLRSFGVEPPMKTSLTTGKETYALAKNDEGFIELSEHDNPVVQHLCAVRLGTKSTIEESRVERFIGIGARNKGLLPIPLKYYGAHTGRWSGLDSVNLQNLPSRDKKKKALKNAIMAPAGHYIINCDSSQIEARVLAWLSGQKDLVEQFARGEDVYSVFASKIYKRDISKAYPVERFVGKTCVLGLGYGTGASKLRHTLKTQPPGADLTEEKCKEIVGLYRETNDRIPMLWRECDNTLKNLINWQGRPTYRLGAVDCIQVEPTGIRLPNGLYIRYANLCISEDNKIVHDSRKGRVSIWGGAVVENVVQALARIIVGEQMLMLKERYRPVLTVHDAAVLVVPEHELENALAFITQVMSTPPRWAEGLPIACEAKYGRSYGDC